MQLHPDELVPHKYHAEEMQDTEKREKKIWKISKCRMVQSIHIESKDWLLGNYLKST